MTTSSDRCSSHAWKQHEDKSFKQTASQHGKEAFEGPTFEDLDSPFSSHHARKQWWTDALLRLSTAYGRPKDGWREREGVGAVTFFFFYGARVFLISTSEEALEAWKSSCSWRLFELNDSQWDIIGWRKYGTKAAWANEFLKKRINTRKSSSTFSGHVCQINNWTASSILSWNWWADLCCICWLTTYWLEYITNAPCTLNQQRAIGFWNREIDLEN